MVFPSVHARLQVRYDGERGLGQHAGHRRADLDRGDLDAEGALRRHLHHQQEEEGGRAAGGAGESADAQAQSQGEEGHLHGPAARRLQMGYEIVFNGFSFNEQKILKECVLNTDSLIS